jgi:hypothetical protein
MIPPKPEGSWIKESVTPDACTLTWRLPSSSGPAGYAPLAMSVVIAVVVGVQFFLMGPRMRNPMQWLFMLVPVLFLLPLLGAWKRPRPESVTLGADHFRHDPGRAGGMWANVDAYRNYGVGGGGAGRSRVVELPKSELGEIVIERIVGALRLRYDVGADRIEIGRYLREPEKEWLAAVIKEWQKAAGAFDPTAHEAGRPAEKTQTGS